ncbi:MAG: hypothetical protein PHU91_06600 [Candidatus Omnitrophica bacterium]|nr:hypothetical protein [Candidatus Omnitrophota bacterium]MDD5237310.1 hypothetical protein [Candidatus Omnitrophota bacterium]MDD5610991.1 hypothetical protein [Candidatus Omnitrophota bacterium]
MKQCPYCKKELGPDSKEKTRNIFKGCLIGCLALVILAFLLFSILVFFGVIAARHISASIKMNFPNPPQYYAGGIEGLMQQFGDMIRHFLEQLRDIFSGQGAQTL